MEEIDDVIKMIKQELEIIEFNQTKNFARAFNTNILDGDILFVRERYYQLQGERDALVRLENRIIGKYKEIKE